MFTFGETTGLTRAFELGRKAAWGARAIDLGFQGLDFLGDRQTCYVVGEDGFEPLTLVNCRVAESILDPVGICPDPVPNRPSNRNNAWRSPDRNWLSI